MISKQSFFSVAMITIILMYNHPLEARRKHPSLKKEHIPSKIAEHMEIANDPTPHAIPMIDLKFASHELKDLMHDVFIENNIKKIPRLIREINKSKRHAQDLYCQVAKWGLQHGYPAVITFVKKLSDKLFHKTASHDEVIAHYILVEAIIHHSNELVPFLLEKMTASQLIKKDMEGFTALDYCLKSDNAQALSLITTKLETVIVPKKRNIIIRATGSLIKNLLWGCISAGTIVGIYYLAK